MDWLAGVLDLIACYVVGNKNRFGFVIFIVVNILWTLFVLKTKVAYGLLFVTIPAIFINIRNLIKWKKY